VKQETSLKVGGKVALFETSFHAGFLFGLFFDPEDGGNMILETSVDFQRSTRFHILVDSSLHNHRCEDLKSYSGFHDGCLLLMILLSDLYTL
jgi:hypothetical protein